MYYYESKAKKIDKQTDKSSNVHDKINGTHGTWQCGHRIVASRNL